MKLQRRHIESECNEGHPDDGGDGYWIYLKPGWKWGGDMLGNVHSIHEDTRAAAYRETVERCDCSDCKEAA